MRNLMRERVRQALKTADVIVNGNRPWDIYVHDDRLFWRILRQGMPGICESYVDGWWDCRAIDQFFERCLRADLPSRLGITRTSLTRWLQESLFNLQRKRLAFHNSEQHYDLGNDLFAAMLDRRMIYSCGYWESASTIDQAQEAKLELICRKLALEPGMRVLDIGCGWGGLAQYAAERFGCHVTGITVSGEQAALARQRCSGLPVKILLQDYRDISGSFDRVVSIGMFEHVGPKNHRTFMQVVHRCIDRDGMCLLHFFATQRSWPNLRDTEVIWIARRIFPNLVVPSLKQVGRAIDGLFVLEDLHNIGSHYDPTLLAWFTNFDRCWPHLRTRYGQRFYRIWKLYLLSCAGAFRSRKYQVWQMVFSKAGVPGGYRPVRHDALHIPRHELQLDGQPKSSAAATSFARRREHFVQL